MSVADGREQTPLSEVLRRTEESLANDVNKGEMIEAALNGEDADASWMFAYITNLIQERNRIYKNGDITFRTDDIQLIFKIGRTIIPRKNVVRTKTH